MTATFTLNNSTATEAFWLTPTTDGEPTEDRIERNLYTVPPLGTYRLRLLRFAKPFEMAKAAEYGGGTQTMTRLELKVIGGPGDGRKCAPMVSLTLGEKSKLGQIVRAAIGRNLGPGEEFNLYDVCHHLDPDNGGHDFMATLKPSDKKDESTGKALHTNIVDGTIVPVESAGEGDDGWPE